MHVVQVVRAVSLADRVDVAVKVVIDAEPLHVLPRLLQEIVACPEDALEVVLVASGHENGGVDGRDPLLRELHVDPAADLVHLGHLHALDVAKLGLGVDEGRVVRGERKELVARGLAGDRRPDAVVFGGDL